MDRPLLYFSVVPGPIGGRGENQEDTMNTNDKAVKVSAQARVSHFRAARCIQADLAKKASAKGMWETAARHQALSEVWAECEEQAAAELNLALAREQAAA